MKLKMSIRDEQYEEYSVKRKKKKKTSTKESCLLHCHEDFDFNDIVKFWETSLTVSLQLALKACVKRHFCLTWNLLKGSHNSQLQCFNYFQTAKKASKIRQDNVFSTEAISVKSCGYHKNCYQSYTNSTALMKLWPAVTPDIESKGSSTRLTSPGEVK